MYLSLHVENDEHFCRSSMVHSTILRQVAIQTFVWHSRTGLGVLFDTQFDRTLENDSEISARSSMRQSNVLYLEYIQFGESRNTHLVFDF